MVVGVNSREVLGESVILSVRPSDYDAYLYAKPRMRQDAGP